MLFDILSAEDRLTGLTLEINLLAFFEPVIFQLIEGVKLDVCTMTAGKLTKDYKPTGLPVASTSLVVEDLGALVALESRAVKRLHHEPIHVLAQVQVATAVRARVVPMCPQ